MLTSEVRREVCQIVAQWSRREGDTAATAEGVQRLVDRLEEYSRALVVRLLTRDG